ncbi:hypothetical protein DFQ28_007069 [Apophysomyces sp. BC1034]|nr:hypothetical protein DFQ30_006964 [Apophysomyces sp. BC1015]KAG0175400.1 hypothetical protein DFQ29_007154 [Apophysomyces sp. BC1021]KAG0186963.1 hypothetical protein DFQ28_007069 [Apophysomyces sp. BC1034]
MDISSSNISSTNKLGEKLWDLDPCTVDDWLEIDLRESGILPNDKDHQTSIDLQDRMPLTPQSECSMSPMKCESPLEEMTARKMTPIDVINASQEACAPPQLAPLLKALSLLGAMQHSSNTGIDNHISTTTKQLPRAASKRARNNEEDDKPLGLQDQLAVKRQKNTDAARRSRLRKVLKMEALEQRVRELEADNERLLLHIAVAESERNTAITKEQRNRERVSKLESQLAEAHKSLMKDFKADTNTQLK